MIEQQIYDLKYYGKLLTSVRAPAGSTDEEVRRRALADFDACPTVMTPPGKTPYEFWRCLKRATIVPWQH